MSAFDTAWDLLKAPYHGTTTDRLEEIMRDGLQPRGSFRDRDEQGDFLPWRPVCIMRQSQRRPLIFRYIVPKKTAGAGQPCGS